MKHTFVIVLLWGILASAWAQESAEFDFARDLISEKWFAGSALVFDCEDKHWVCVSEEDHKRCGADRDKTLVKGRRELACAPAEIYQARSQCYETLKRLSSEGNAYPRVCLHPKERGRFIGFRSTSNDAGQ